MTEGQPLSIGSMPPGVIASRKIAVFSKYFGYDVGGAERSVLELLKEKDRQGYQITIVRIPGIKTFGACDPTPPLPVHWARLELPISTDLERFSFVEYAVNRRRILSFFSNLSPDYELYSYGIFAPAAILGFRGPTVYLVRDEHGLGWYRNYYRGLFYWVREVYAFAQAPFRAIWYRDLLAAIERSRLVANSQFIARELRKLAPQAHVDVITPQLDCKSLLKRFNAVPRSGLKKGVVAIGERATKGGDIIRKLAQCFPSETFYLYDPSHRRREQAGNLVRMPWESDPALVYARAKVVLIPSRWEEAFPRVALEAQCVGVPVIASCRGGLPEAVEDQRRLITNLEDISEWASTLSHILQEVNCTGSTSG